MSDMSWPRSGSCAGHHPRTFTTGLPHGSPAAFVPWHRLRGTAHPPARGTTVALPWPPRSGHQRPIWCRIQCHPAAELERRIAESPCSARLLANRPRARPPDLMSDAALVRPPLSGPGRTGHGSRGQTARGRHLPAPLRPPLGGWH
jgi:hypothetical protein